MKAAEFFQNSKGEQTLIQRPNLLLCAWLLVQLVNMLVFKFEQRALMVLASMLLFAWAYNELTQGDSRFRKVLGGVILLLIIVNVFVQWQ